MEQSKSGAPLNSLPYFDGNNYPPLESTSDVFPQNAR